MIFKLVSEREVENIFITKFSDKTLYDSFELAIDKFDNINYLNNKINETNYWCDDINVFIKKYLEKELSKYIIKPISTFNNKEKFDFIIDIKEQIIILKEFTILIYDKTISNYFGDLIDIKLSNYDFEMLLKEKGDISITLSNLIDNLELFFKEDYRLYLPILYKLLTEKKTIYKPELFENILKSKKYLEDSKLFNIKKELQLKRENGVKYYQSEYVEFNTGRLSQKNNSLQTIPKENRDILEADEGCYLIEIDFEAFEYNILLDLLGLEKPNDPHTEILEYLRLEADRNVGKRINYSSIYGMSADNVAKVIKEEYDIDINVSLLANHPLFSKELEIKCENSIILSYFKRPILTTKSWALKNNFIQGTAADIFFNKFQRVLSILPKNKESKIILQNHDSLLIQLKIKDIINTDIVEEILECMTSSLDIFTFKADFKYGKIWSELT